MKHLAGIRVLKLTWFRARIEAVTVDMGEPHLKPAEIPVSDSGERFVDRPLRVHGRIWNVTAVSMGNPHAVVFTRDIDRLDLPDLGPHFEHHALFPRRTNTEFVGGALIGILSRCGSGSAAPEKHSPAEPGPARLWRPPF